MHHQSRAFYSESIDEFAGRDAPYIVGCLVQRSPFSVDLTQRNAWLDQIQILQSTLRTYCGRGNVYFEYSVPRLGQRIDVVVLIDHVVFVIEFKVGETEFKAAALDQVWDYALDLKHFHETSHNAIVAPILVATRATPHAEPSELTLHQDDLFVPIRASVSELCGAIEQVLKFKQHDAIDASAWETGRYCPTPTVIEAAKALCSGHGVEEISRNDATAINLGHTSDAIAEIIRSSKTHSRKSLCFVTGVPGAGKTLVGLNIATQHVDPASDLYSVFLSGNGPLVAVLREALARDRVLREAEQGRTKKKGVARSEVKAFIQNVHHFRDDCLLDETQPPVEHIALFDEAQRAWNLEQTAKFMRQKKGRSGFKQSEPEFLISCLDRHRDWAVIVCLVGGGQEINTGEAGISEWINAAIRQFPDWDIHISSRLSDSEYASTGALGLLSDRAGVQHHDDLHLAVSMRSFRAESVSALVKHLLDQNEAESRRVLSEIGNRYPIVLTRDLTRAKEWLTSQARGSERFGVVVSSQAQRLKPYAIDVRAPVDPIHWFLGGKEDVRSSYYLEDVATEFHVQGLELDWCCVVWDGDFRYAQNGWRHFSFVGDRWNQVKKPERQLYMKNAYRVLLTRARQGMVLVVPAGDERDHTRRPEYYDETFEYLKRIGFRTV